MNKFNFIFKKSFWKNVLAVVVIAILCAGIIGGGIALGKYIKDKKKSPTLSVRLFFFHDYKPYFVACS